MKDTVTRRRRAWVEPRIPGHALGHARLRLRAAGRQIALDRRITLGRGAGSDVVVEDASIHLHAALELGARLPACAISAARTACA
jgi:hypothetical protein